jgi:hypothetical protein
MSKEKKFIVLKPQEKRQNTPIHRHLIDFIERVFKALMEEID